MSLKKSAMVILCFVSAFALLSCDHQDAPKSNRAEEIRDRNKLKEILRPLEGTYHGEVSNASAGSDPFPIEIKIFLTEEPSGVNEDGETIFRPQLRGRYRRLDFPIVLTNEKSLFIRYYAETGEITMSSLNTTTGIQVPGGGSVSRSPLDNFYLSISGQMISDQIVGGIRNHRGLLGQISLKKVAP